MPSSYFIYLLFRKVETFNESFKAGSYLFQEHLLLVGGEHVGLSLAIKNQLNPAPAMVGKSGLKYRYE